MNFLLRVFFLVSSHPLLLKYVIIHFIFRGKIQLYDFKKIFNVRHVYKMVELYRDIIIKRFTKERCSFSQLLHKYVYVLYL